MATLRLLLHYFVLVGLPLFGVVVVMNLGDRISPPPPIGGKWRLQLELDDNVSTACAGRLSGSEDPVIAIAQSGVFLEIEFPNTFRHKLSGHLDGDQISASGQSPLMGGLLRVSGTLYPGGPRQTMAGVIDMPGRHGCVPIRFVAERLAAPRPPSR